MIHNSEPPELVILAVTESRDTAELLERCLIRNFNESVGGISNDYKYFNRRQEHGQLILDDIPFWMVPLNAEYV